MTYPSLYHLKYFADAVELGSVTASAAKNLVSHSAVSQAIKSIESRLSIRLLVHKKRAFEVTPEGRALAAKVKPLFGELNMLSDTVTVDGDMTGRLVIGMSRTIGHVFLSPILTELKKKYPLLQIEIKFATTPELVERSAQDFLDLSITIGNQPMPTLRQTKLRSGKFILIEPVKRNKGAEDPFMLTEPRYETELLKKAYYQRYKKALPVFLEIRSWDSIARLVADGHGCGLVPEIAIPPECRAGIKKISSPWFQCDYEIYLNEGKSFQKRSLREAVTKVIAEVVGKSRP